MEFVARLDLCRGKGGGSSMTNAMKGDFLNPFPNILETIWEHDASGIDPVRGVSTGDTETVVLLFQG